MTKETRILIAMQKSGRLSEKSLELFKQSGIVINNGKRQLLYRIPELPIDILFVRDDDIPMLVSEGTCDLGIVGSNVFKEVELSKKDEEFNAAHFFSLGFAKCRLSLAVPEHFDFHSPQSIDGLRIATTYPCILKDFLKKNKLKCEVAVMSGSVEISPHLKISDIICDIVSTGATLVENGMKEAYNIFDSEAIFIRNTKISDEKLKIASKLVSRLDCALIANKSKYVMLNAPKSKIKEITNLLPGSESPTIMPLADENKVAIHAVCSEPVFWDTMEKLKAAGASSILVLPIEKMML
ncbi:MAG: ATP phosphoribosyltransferase [Alphaproteobacteria bacterium ADurb.Bin438]|nr:MAG: ATP phosphoribosyltransferase [Alphaproteobacteria bacterium ADurb.Bin438]